MPRYDLAGNPIEDDPPPNNSQYNQPYGQQPPPGQPPTYGQAPGSFGLASPPPQYGAPPPFPGQQPPFGGQPPYGGNPGQQAWPPSPTNAPPTGYTFNPFTSNSSGTQGDVPFEIDRLKWNWGAFMMNRLWLYSHGMSALGSILWATGFGLRFVSNVIPGPVGGGIYALYVLANLGVSIYFGMNGHRIAWRNRRFDSIQQYFAVQRAWMIGGFAVWSLLFFVIMFGIFAVVNANRQLSSMPHTYHSYNYSGGSQGSGYGNSSGYGSSSGTSGGDDTSDDSGSGSTGTGTYGSGQGSGSTAAPIQGFSPNNNGQTGN